MRARVGVAVASVVLMALAGCSSDDEPTAEETEASEATGTPTESEPTEATTEPSATVEPAAGPVVDSGVTMSYRLPAEIDWTLTRERRTAQFREGLEAYMVFQFEFETTTPGTLRDLARARLRNAPADVWPRLELAEDRTVNGVDGYVLTGVGKSPDLGFAELKDDLYYEFGAVTPRGWMYLQFEMPKDNAKYRGWIESVLASVEWK